MRLYLSEGTDDGAGKLAEHESPVGRSREQEETPMTAAGVQLCHAARVRPEAGPQLGGVGEHAPTGLQAVVLREGVPTVIQAGGLHTISQYC